MRFKFLANSWNLKTNKKTEPVKNLAFFRVLNNPHFYDGLEQYEDREKMVLHLQ